MDWLNRIFKLLSPEVLILPEWYPKTNWDEANINLLKEYYIDDPSEESTQNIITKSDNFCVGFPSETNRCKYLREVKNISENTLNKNINSVYPVIHEGVLKLCADFLRYKRIHGSIKERSIYNSIGLKGLIDRLINKRAVCFVGPWDKYQLLDGTVGGGQWETIGTDDEQPPLTIDHCLTYDELKLSPLLYLSSYTYFVNEGHRTNEAVYQEDRQRVESEGIIIGMVGPRLYRNNVMERQEIVITEKENTKERGFGVSIENSIPKLFSEFYDEETLEYSELTKKIEASEKGRYISISERETFDNIFYYKRLTISIDTLLAEANARANANSQLAYLHVVGLGLGAWKISPHQEEMFMNVFGKRLECLGEKLIHISDIYFAYINATKCGKFRNEQVFPIPNHPNGGIRILIGKRDPHCKLVGKDEGKLLVVSYAWDGNALPGNDYWYGSFTSSGDPAAACSTQIAEIHNTHINPLVCADNLRIATQGEILSIKEYRSKLLENHDRIL